MTVTVASKKPTMWKTENASVGDAIADFHECERESKALAVRAAFAKDTLKIYCEQRWIEVFGSTGEAPPTPVKLANSLGQTVSFVVTDRSAGLAIDDATYEELVDLLGEETVGVTTEERPTFRFNEDILSQATTKGKSIKDVVSERLQRMRTDLLTKGLITQEQADGLLTFGKPRVFLPYFLVHLPHYCGLNVDRFVQVLNLIGSAVIRTIKA